MATLFFEGFNISNTDSSPYLDDRYWTRPINPFYPPLFYNTATPDSDIAYTSTQGVLGISGYFLNTNPIQSPTPLQLSGIPNLDSDKLYISFRIKGLSYNDMVNNTFPYTAKLLTLCDADNETLNIEVVKTTGTSIQGGSWLYPDEGIGLSIKQSGNEIGLFDLRIDGLTRYDMSPPNSFSSVIPSTKSMQIRTARNDQTRFIHLEFLLDRTTNNISLRLEGSDIFNKLTSYPYSNYASGQNIGTINNLKFYSRGIANNTTTNWWDNNETYGTQTYIKIDDLVICNNSGYDPKIWIGPKTRIFHLQNEPDLNPFIKHDWLPPKGQWHEEGGTLYSRDGDSSFKYSDISGSILSFEITNNRIMNPGSYSNYIQNGIGGIRLFNDVKKTFLDSDFVNVVATGDPTVVNNYIEVGDKYTVTETNYGIKNSFIINNPFTSMPWTSGTFFKERGEFNNGGVVRNYTSGIFGIKKL